MTEDPFDALDASNIGWHYTERGASPTPAAISATRAIYALLGPWATSVRLVPAVGRGVLVQAVCDECDVFVSIHADGATVTVYGMPRGDRTYTLPDASLGPDIDAWLRAWE